jgi:hypothetical protein
MSSRSRELGEFVAKESRGGAGSAVAAWSAAHRRHTRRWLTSAKRSSSNYATSSSRLTALDAVVPKNLLDRKPAIVARAMSQVLDARKGTMRADSRLCFSAE